MSWNTRSLRSLTLRSRLLALNSWSAAVKGLTLASFPAFPAALASS